MKVRVLIGGNDDWHDIITAGASLRDTLVKAGFDASLRVGWGEQQRGGDDVAALVMYTNGMRMPPADQETIRAKVEAGLGLVAIHTCAVLAEEPAFHATWLNLIGHRFVHHPPFSRFRVSIDRDHPVVRGVASFDIEDELYITEPWGSPMEVLATAEFEGKKHPMVAVREAGRGRVCYLADGHDRRALENPSFQAILANAVHWAGSERTPAGRSSS